MKKFLALSLAIVMLFSVSVIGAAASPEDFTDIPDDWAREGIINAIENGLLNGTDGKILPNDNLTRAQLAAIINRAVKATSTGDVSLFVDVPADAWYYTDIAKAVKMGTFGGSGNKMRPNDPITREETFVVVARAFLFPEGEESSIGSFNDAADVSEWATSAIAALISEGYVQGGSGNRINPKSNITRAEFATIMDRLVSEYISEAGEVTEVTEDNIMINVADVILSGVTVNGNLYIGDGVGDGDVTLHDVVCLGRLVVRGGGEDSVIITGSSEIGTIIISKKDGIIRVTTEDGAKVDVIYVEDDSEDVIFEGVTDSIIVNSYNVTVTVRNGEINAGVVNSNNSQIIVEEGSTVKTIDVNGSGVKISGEGTVEAVNSTVEDVIVTTTDTEVEIDVPVVPVDPEPPVTPSSSDPTGTPSSGTGVGSTKSYKLTDIIFNDDEELGEVTISEDEIEIDLSALAHDVDMSTVKFVTDNDTKCRVASLDMEFNSNEDVSILTIIGGMFTAVGRTAPDTFEDDTTMFEIRELFALAYSLYDINSSVFEEYGINMLDESTAILEGRNVGDKKTFTITLNVGENIPA